MRPEKLLIITAPSGSGKTTLVRRLLAARPELRFSISACTRAPRGTEVHGQDYYFIAAAQFQELVQQEAFVEWEMVYEGKYYGTLKSEITRIWDSGHYPLVDIDVKGALAIQKQYPAASLSIFIQPPSLEELRRRLLYRGTETPQSLEERVAKAAFELTFASAFDVVLVNDDLEMATQHMLAIVEEFLGVGQSQGVALG